MTDLKLITLRHRVSMAAHKCIPLFSGKQQKMIRVQALIKADKKLCDYENNAVANGLTGMDRKEKGQ